MSGKIVTRELSTDDYDAALQLWQRVEGLEVAEGDDKEGVAQFVARNPGLSRVAIDGSTVVGVAMCGHDGRRGYIYHLAVDPTYRRYGLGKRLVQECLDGLRRVGIVRALILVADYNLGGAESGSAPAGRIFLGQCRWELMSRSNIVHSERMRRISDQIGRLGKGGLGLVWGWRGAWLKGGDMGSMKVGGKYFRTIWRKPDDERAVQLIDQRFLPHDFVIEEVRSVEQMATAIREMHVRGAGLIGASAGYGMYIAALEAARRDSFDEHMTRAAAQLSATRPTAVNLSWAIERQLQNIAAGKTVDEKVALALRTADLIADEDAEHCWMIG